MDEDFLDNQNNEDTMLKSIKYWVNLILGGLALPVAFPWLVYHLYNTHFKNKVHKSRSLRDKVVLITGASSGLGEALAHAFFKAGCKVVLSARRIDALKKVKDDLMEQWKESSHEPVILPLDLNELKDIPEKVEELISTLGNIDILVNNGGVSYRGEILNTSIDVDLRVMVVNYFGHVALTKAVIPHMIKNGGGHVVSISSVQGRIAIPFRSAYTASKHATQAFFDSLRAELADSNIYVSVISPGYIKTNLSLNAVTGDGSSYGAMDQTTASGMDPALAADAVLTAVVTKQNEVVLSNLMPRLAILLRILFPWLYFHLMKNRAYRLRRKAVGSQETN